MKTCIFVNFKHENTKHACFHVNFLFSGSFYPLPHYIIMVKGLSNWLLYLLYYRVLDHHGRDAPNRVARISNVTSWLFWKSLMKGNTSPGR